MKMFGFDTLDWRQVKIDWDAITDDIIKAGTPMDKDGHICNDGNVFGILMDDVQRKRNVQGRVVISGCMDMKAAEEHSGIKLSAEAKAALPDVWTQSGGGGVSSWNDIPDKPDGLPYVEKGYGVILPETTVEIPEGSAGLPGILNVSSGNPYEVNWNGTFYNCVAQSTNLEGMDAIALGNVGALTGVSSTDEPFVLVCFDVLLEGQFGTMVLSFDGVTTVTLSISGEMDTIHPIDERCLPVTGINIINATYDGDTLTVEKPYAEIAREAVEGKIFMLKIRRDDVGAFHFADLTVAGGDGTVVFTTAQAGGANIYMAGPATDGKWVANTD